ncbi:hypothetical protein ACY4RH_001882 [Listeria monocytogenes]|uniref:hypothetical protein n=1 Tax=Listeria TaxID=1637 RepID=UPI00077A7863|nr:MULTISPECIES: hypothetical protein [Listeria]EHK2495037.1 hypothetical protein [Listeria monocytogenes]EJP1872254.1 hypothetical protein [Listeria monocytogenes]EJP1877577.1 hypothetical protein [Listeria monocytogenes]EJS5844157.1 hypothetical protein [Listeria monocytogenes]EJS6011375.1 hypothetical protein [Listeria monocytogenes]
MDIELLQNEIDNTEYWDMSILDIQTRYFGDEVYIFIENNEKTCWKISFISCYKVSYETDANWRTIDNVKEMRGGQLGYDGQDISLKKYEENENFVQCSLDLSIMLMNIVCKNILVEELSMKDNLFFWQDK